MRYWKEVDANGITTTVEAYSHSLPISGAIEITESEALDFIRNLPAPDIEPRIDPEIESIKQRLDIIEAQLMPG